MVLHEAPDCNYQWRMRKINFFAHRAVFSEIDDVTESMSNAQPFHDKLRLKSHAVLDFDPLYVSLLYQDEKGLLHVLATQPELLASLDGFRLSEVAELAVQWPAGLKLVMEHLIRVAPTIPTKCYHGLRETLIRKLPEWHQRVCKSEGLCNDSTCSESLKIMLDSNCSIPDIVVRDLLRWNYPCNAVSVLLRHLKKWRDKLQDVVCEHLPVYYQSEISALIPLDYKAPEAIAKLEKIGVFPYELFGLHRGDYRLGPTSVPGYFGSTIFGLITTTGVAQLAFDIGFRDTDALFGGTTPLRKSLSRLLIDFDYPQWLISHGADVTTNAPWAHLDHSQYRYFAPLPRRKVIHLIAYCLASFVIFFDNYMDRLPHMRELSLILGLAISDGCSCACTTKFRGCHPLTIFLNQLASNNFIYKINDNINTPELVETIIRCLTFERLGIRHTCCATIPGSKTYISPDYGDDFEELRAEDAERVCQLDELVTEFVELYRLDGSPLSAFIKGSWADRMELIDAEEKNIKWSAQERDAVRSIGVVPKDDEEDNTNESERINTEYSVKRNAVGDAYPLEHWIENIDRVANGKI
ncbi:hypothetical protein F5Y19DRAFT_490470 [Xylariaceae sp. FL1651]|nr:hypothetical protein F5Y19DRAFT_490470 [Xylariaceae sp. FL1651]